MIKKLLFFLFTIFMSVNMMAGEVTILPTDFTPVETSDYSVTKGGVTVSVVASTVTSDQMRIFKGKTITISSDSVITSIVFTCTANGTTKYGPGCFAAQEGYTYDGKIGTWIGTINSITFTASSNQVRATQIIIVTNGDTSSIEPTPYTPLDTITCDSARIAALAGKTDSAYVLGYVTEFVEYSDEHHNTTFWVADTKNGGQVFEIYRAVCNSAEEAPEVGDLVLSLGKLTTYTKNQVTTPEFGSGCTFEIVQKHEQTPTDITNIEDKAKGYKVFDGKQILIIKNGKTYNILGQRID